MKKQHRVWIVLTTVAVVLVVFIGIRIYQNGGSVTVPLRVSFVQQANHSGTHIWLKTQDNNDVNKDTIVSKILVLRNGKVQVYQLFDNNITLGKLSSMSNVDTINLAKRQDEKYATIGAISEVNSYLKNGNQVGQEADFTDDVKNIASGNIRLHYTFNRLSTKAGQVAIKDLYPTVNSLDKSLGDNTDSDYNKESVYLSDLDGSKYKKSSAYGDKYGLAIIKHIKDSDYQEPKSQRITVKNITDDSGNEIVSQVVSYQTVDFFNSDQADRNAYNLALKNKARVARLISLSTYEGYGENPSKVDPEVAVGIENIDHFSKYLAKLKQADLRGTKIYNQLFANQEDYLTRGVYGNHYWKSSFTMDKPFISQDIYKARYIGYHTTNGKAYNYLLTKAQNEKQKVFFSK